MDNGGIAFVTKKEEFTLDFGRRCCERHFK